MRLAARLPAGTTLYNDAACTSAVGTATGNGPVINPTTPSAFTPVGSPVPSDNVVKSPAASETFLLCIRCMCKISAKTRWDFQLHSTFQVVGKSILHGVRWAPAL